MLRSTTHLIGRAPKSFGPKQAHLTVWAALPALISMSTRKCNSFKCVLSIPLRDLNPCRRKGVAVFLSSLLGFT